MLMGIHFIYSFYVWRFNDVTRKAATIQCQEGDIIAEPIKNSLGNTVAMKNTVLNRYIIHELMEMGIKYVKILGAASNCPGSDVEISYTGAILDTKTMVSDLAAGKPLNEDIIDGICDLVYCGMYDSCQVLKVIDERKSADKLTYRHSVNVAYYSMLLGKWLNLDNEAIRNVTKAGLLHDVGKSQIPLEILNKKGRLSVSEFDMIKKHAYYGYEMVRTRNCVTEKVSEAVLQHHEREDKSGYPYGIGGTQLNIYTKIVAVADVFDAMTSERVYKKRSTPFEAFEMFFAKGTTGFDHDICDTFLTNISACYTGSKVLLSSGATGEIAYVPPYSVTQPVIDLGLRCLDLSKECDMRILSMQ